MKAVTSLLLLGLSLLPQLLWAQEWVDGTIRRIDTSGQKMTIKHEEIKAPTLAISARQVDRWEYLNREVT